MEKLISSIAHLLPDLEKFYVAHFNQDPGHVAVLPFPYRITRARTLIKLGLRTLGTVLEVYGEINKYPFSLCSIHWANSVQTTVERLAEILKSRGISDNTMLGKKFALGSWWRATRFAYMHNLVSRSIINAIKEKIPDAFAFDDEFVRKYNILTAEVSAGTIPADFREWLGATRKESKCTKFHKAALDELEALAIKCADRLTQK